MKLPCYNCRNYYTKIEKGVLGMDAKAQVTELLVDWGSGKEPAFDKLFSLVYEELRTLASGYMRRERTDHTLQTTALVNEAYIKLVGQKDPVLHNRVHFFALAAKVMRQILIDHARSKQYEKRGGGVVKISLDDTAVLSDERATQLVALDDALTELAKFDVRQSQIVELRFFGGLTLSETAQFLKISPDTVTRDWNMAKAWLYRQMST
jgi:RNA polymerase sigma-70 factor, ECF subfamily